MFVLLALCTVGPLASQAQYNDNVAKAGDWIQIILPGIAAGTTVVLKDWEGFKQIALYGGLTIAIVHTTKFAAGKTRPDVSDTHSFPSGHTAAAFYGPAFIHRRYGWKYSVPFYFGAMFVGYSRMYADRHWADDVFFGATLSMVMNYAFTTPYSDYVKVAPQVGQNGIGFTMEINW